MPHATRPGDVLADRYRLVDLLTESGGGRFWRAYDRVLERHVAIHVIRGDDDRAPALMEAARRSATVLDPRMLRVLDADATADSCYVVNEWGWGTSLDIVVAGTGPLGPRRAAWLVAEVADSVATAHAAGVAHGRLNPENVLIDRAGNVRLIGLCVDAALHGVATDQLDHDLADLAGLLYCALTTKWAGASGSIVTAAPRDHGEVLRPRKVRAGIPRPLDSLCDEVLHPAAGGGVLGDRVSTARGVSDFLAEFVGDPTGMPDALLASTPDVLPDEEQVVLPPVPEIRPHDDETDPTLLTDTTDTTDTTETRVGVEVQDAPTEAGVPIFGDDDDVSWFQRRSTPPPPPPPFEEPPERPLFAPEPVAGAPVRTPRADSPSERTGTGDGFWPWDTGTNAGHVGPGGRRAIVTVTDTDDRPVPGRTWLRLASILAVVLLLIVAVVVAVNLGRGKTPLGGDPEPDPTNTAPTRTDGSPTRQADPLTGVAATAFDPQSDDGEENDDAAPLAVDGDPDTTWSTSGYNDQLGPPPGLKTGVGLVLDLDGAQEVSQVDLTLVGAPTDVSVYVVDGDPDDLAGLDPTARGTADGDQLTLALDTPTSGTHLVVWLTSLPPGDDGRFRGSIAEVVVRGG